MAITSSYVVKMDDMTTHGCPVMKAPSFDRAGLDEITFDHHHIRGSAIKAEPLKRLELCELGSTAPGVCQIRMVQGGTPGWRVSYSHFREHERRD